MIPSEVKLGAEGILEAVDNLDINDEKTISIAIRSFNQIVRAVADSKALLIKVIDGKGEMFDSDILDRDERDKLFFSLGTLLSVDYPFFNEVRKAIRNFISLCQ